MRKVSFDFRLRKENQLRKGVPDRRRDDLVYSRVGVHTLGDVIVADPTGGSNMMGFAHINSWPRVSYYGSPAQGEGLCLGLRHSIPEGTSFTD